jgi:hypothetical protein
MKTMLITFFNIGGIVVPFEFIPQGQMVNHTYPLCGNTEAVT